MSAVAMGSSYFLEHAAAGEMPELALRRPLASLRHLFTSPRWLAGYIAGWVGWGIYILALNFAPLCLVQAVAAGGVGTIAVATWRWGDSPLTAKERGGVLACLCGLAAVAVSLAGHASVGARPGWQSSAGWIIGCVIAAAVLVLMPARLLAPGAAVGAAAGMLFAAGDISTKAALVGVGWLLVPVLLACTALGFVALQLAFQRGKPLQTAGICTLLTNAVPICAGVVLFDERLPAAGFGILRVGGFAAVVAGSALLAHRSVVPPVPPAPVTE